MTDTAPAPALPLDVGAGPPVPPGPAPAADPAPKRGPGRPKGSTTKRRPDPTPKPAGGAAKRGPGAPSAREKLERKLGEQLAGIGAMLALVHQADGLTIVKHSESVAASLAKLADENPKVRRFLEGGLTGSAWLGVAVAVGGLGLELAANHGALGPVGAVLSPPDAGAGTGSDGLDLSALADLLGDSAPGADGSR